MNERPPIAKLRAAPLRHSQPSGPVIDISDIPDGIPGTRLGTLRDAIDHAKAWRKASAIDPAEAGDRPKAP
jgi:hypothetical protein